MSKVSMPRPRYIALRLAGEAVSRRALGNAIRDQARKEGWQDAEAPQLTRFAWPHAIVRVEHDRALAARAMLPRVGWAAPGDARRPVSVETLGTSGTILALTTRLGILARRDAAASEGGRPLPVRGKPAPPAGGRTTSATGTKSPPAMRAKHRDAAAGKSGPRQA